MSEVVQKGDPLYQKLLDAWIAGGMEKGYVLLSGHGQFKVNRPSDDVVSFTRDTTEHYTSFSTQHGG